MKFRRVYLLIFTVIWSVLSPAQDLSDTVKVHFLYGSRPSKKNVESEEKWFGGKLGGHVGIEFRKGEIIDFIPSGDFHIFGKKDPLHGRFVSRSVQSFWRMFGADPDSSKGLIVFIPVTTEMKCKLDSVAASYLNQSPYDYAFFGMRCASAAYDLLGCSGVLPSRSKHGACWRFFYPRKLRRKLLREAELKSWPLLRMEGTDRRVWDHH